MSQTKNRMVLLCWNEHFDWMMKGIWLVSTNQSAVFQNSIVILRWNKHSDWILQGIWLVSTIQSTLFYNSNLKFVYHNRSRALYVQWTHSPIANQSVFSKVNFQVPNSLALNGYRDKPRLTEKSKAWLSFAWLSFAKPKKIQAICNTSFISFLLSVSSHQVNIRWGMEPVNQWNRLPS